MPALTLNLTLTVCKGLRECPGLVHLNLSGAPHTIAVDDSSHAALIPGAEFQPSNTAGLDGGIAISELVKRCNKVRHLALRHMSINDTATEVTSIGMLP